MSEFVFCKTCNLKISTFLSTVESCASTVFKSLGYGLGEAVYQKALEILLYQEFQKSFSCSHSKKSISSEAVIPISIQGWACGTIRSDLIVYWTNEAGLKTEIIIELKATSTNLDEKNVLQLLAYLRATKNTVGILINFTQKSKLISSILSGDEGEPTKKKRKKTTNTVGSTLLSVSKEELEKEPTIEFIPVILR